MCIFASLHCTVIGWNHIYNNIFQADSVQAICYSVTSNVNDCAHTYYRLNHCGTKT